MGQSDVRRLIASVQELGKSCSALADVQNGAQALLRKECGRLRQSSELSDIADSLQAAGTCWNSIEQSVKAASVEAYRFASSCL